MTYNVINVYCDGSYKNGVASWAYGCWKDENLLNADTGILKPVKYLSNNLAELVAVIEGVKAIPKGFSAIVYTDSRYIVTGLENVVKGLPKPSSKYKYHWAELLCLLKQKQAVILWVKGHADNLQHNIVDGLARHALQEYQYLIKSKKIKPLELDDGDDV